MIAEPLGRILVGHADTLARSYDAFAALRKGEAIRQVISFG